MNLFVDIDGQLCTVVPSLQYDKAKPIKRNIEKVNSWFHQGHHIVLWTARGQLSGIDWSEITRMQLEEWGVLFDELRFDKPAFDMFFDDKAHNLNQVSVGVVSDV